MTGRLIVSVSGVRDNTAEGIADFSALLRKRNVPISYLVAPRLSGGYRLLADASTAEWLRMRRNLGDAILLHGFDVSASKKRKREFAVLPSHEANLRLMAADRTLEQLGLRTRLFAPPGWTASPGTISALPDNGFRLLAEMGSISDLVRKNAERARVLGIGAGFLHEAWWCRMLVQSSERVARRGGVVRLAVSARQLSRSGPRQAMLDAIDLSLMHGAKPTVYEWRPVRPVQAAA